MPEEFRMVLMPRGFLLLNSKLSSNEVKEIRVALKAAYQRGREDAAKGLTNWYLANGDEPLSEWESECVAAARGDGEQT